MTAMTADADRPARRASLIWGGRLVAGLVLLGILAGMLWVPGAWATKLFVWVLLTILADEFAGWFGYAGLALGALVFFAPGTTPEQWFTIFPLVGGALFALLLLKHSGGPFVLPFAAALFAGTLLALGRYGGKLDPTLTLPANEQFQRMALIAMLSGVAVSFVRQLVGLILRAQARRRARLAAADPLTTPRPAPLSDPQTKLPLPASPDFAAPPVPPRPENPGAPQGAKRE